MKPTRSPNFSLMLETGDVLINAQSLHKWQSTLKSAVFGLSTALLSLVGVGGELVCESVGTAVR